MSVVCVCFLPPASRMITARPRRVKYTRYPGPTSIRNSDTPSPTRCDVAWVARCQAFDTRLDLPSREALSPTQLDRRS